MSSNKHRAEYELRVNRVLDYIREHIGEELSLETLAGVAAFSPFHFHRIFKAMTGENVKELVQRTRLESAASRLVYAQDEILAVALDHGFRSASAFARAFKERFGVTASEWRAGAWRARKNWLSDGNPCTAVGKGGEAAGDAAAQDGSTTGQDAGFEEIPMDVTVKNLPSYRVAYLRNVGPYGAAGGIPDLWLKLARWAGARDLWTPDRICIGTAIDDPMVTAPEKCRYDAAIVVPDGFEPDGGVNVNEVPGGKHAVAPFEGSSVEIGGAWKTLFGRWLPESGFQPEGPCFEVYRGESWDAKNDLFRCELCIPIKPL